MATEKINKNPIDEHSTKEPSVAYLNTENLPSLFQEHNFSICVTTYQACRTLLFSSSSPSKLSMLMRTIPKPTGIALGKRFLAVASKYQIWLFAGAKNLRNKEGEVRPNDINFLPRYSHVTGNIDAHELAWHNDRLIVVNTLYSCLSVLEPDWSFTPIWKPKFISKICAEDRCHLNGIAVDEKGPKYVTALGKSDKAAGWRDNKVTGGILIDVTSNEIIAEGFAMPHSPRIYAGKIWLLDSGNGALVMIDPKTAAKTNVIRFHGFLRGLNFYKHYALLGVCKAREKSVFGNLPIEKEFKEFQCGVAVVNLNTVKLEGYIHFTKGVEELFDIAVLPNYTNPYMVGFEGDEIEMIKIFNETIG